MSSFLISGGTGLAGYYIAEAALALGHDVTVLSRNPPKDGHFSGPVTWIGGALDPDADYAPALQNIDIFVHCAFDHVPGKYRGGEGEDRKGFIEANLKGSLALFGQAAKSGVSRAIFLSSRAVYGPKLPGVVLREDMLCRPDTLYGEVKAQTEGALDVLASDQFLPISLRVTGIYGPPPPGIKHKWNDLFMDFVVGSEIAPRAGTEVHGRDLAAAVMLAAGLPRDKLAAHGAAPAFNVSDIVLDRHDLLAAYAELHRLNPPLPPRADASALNVMDCSRLKALGWKPRGYLDLSGL